MPDREEILKEANQNLHVAHFCSTLTSTFYILALITGQKGFVLGGVPLAIVSTYCHVKARGLEQFYEELKK